MDQLGNRLGVGGGEALLRPPLPFLQQAFGQIFKDDVNEFFSTLIY
jgi:hypothetical protein